MRSILDPIRTLWFPAAALVAAAAPALGGVPAHEPADLPRSVQIVEEAHPDSLAAEHFLEARFLQETSRYSEAIERFRLALQFDPHAPGIELPMAEAFLELAQIDSARTYARNAMHEPEMLPEALRLIARCDMYEGAADSAIVQLRRVLELEPDDQWAFLNLLSLLQQRGRPEEALALIEPAIPENLATAHLYARRAALRSQVGRSADAVLDLVQAMEKDPEYPGVEQAILQQLPRLEDPLLVRGAVEALLAEQPGLLGLRRAWVAALFRADHWREAEPQLESYLAHQPDDGRALMQAGLLDMRAGRAEEALPRLERAATLLRGDPEPYRWIWRARASREEWDGALLAADSLLARSSRDLEGLWFRALALFETGRTAEARPVLETVLDRDPTQRQGLLLYSAILSEAEEWSQADARLAAYLAVRPDDAEVLLRRAIGLEREGRFEEAEGLLLEAIRLEPQLHLALNYLGYMWIDRGIRLDEGMRMVEQALSLDPANPAYLDSYGWGFYRQGRLEDARLHLERAVASGGDHPEILSHLGQVYEALGRLQEALAQYRKALQYNPEDAELKSRLERLEPR